jgi:hypothetical protein
VGATLGAALGAVPRYGLSARGFRRLHRALSWADRWEIVNFLVVVNFALVLAAVQSNAGDGGGGGTHGAGISRHNASIDSALGAVLCCFVMEIIARVALLGLRVGRSVGGSVGGRRLAASLG